MIHDSYRNYKRAKRQFRNALNMKYELHMKDVYQDLDSAAECDIRLFWKLVKKQKKRTSRTYPEIHENGNVYDDPDGVAKAFADYYEQVYTPSSDDAFDDEFHRTIEESYQRIVKECSNMTGYLPGGHIKCTFEEISTLVNKLKRRKAPGPDQITYEHIIFGGPRIHRCIAKLFNGIILQGKIPYAWKKGFIVPLYKGGDKQKTSTNSYRPVALL